MTTLLAELFERLELGEYRVRARVLESARIGQILDVPSDEVITSGLASELADNIEHPNLKWLTRDQILLWICFYYESHDWDRLETLVDFLHQSPVVDTASLLGTIRLAWSHVLRGRYDETKRLLNLTQERSVQCPSSLRMLGELAHLEAYVLYRLEGDVPAARSEIEFAVASLRKSGETLYFVRSLAFRSMIQKTSGDLTGALSSLEEALREVSVLGNRKLFGFVLGQRAIMEMRSGMLQRANRTLLALRSFGGGTIDPITSSSAALLDLYLATQMGRFARARRRRSLIASGRPQLDDFRSIIFLEYEGVLNLSVGDSLSALHSFDTALERLQSRDFASYELPELHLRRAEALNALHRYSEARAACDSALEMLDRPGEGLERGHIYRQRGLANHAMARPRDARVDLDRAEVELRRVGDRYELTRLLLDRAELYPRETEGALRDAEEAVTLAEQVGVGHLLERARDICDLAQMRFNEDRRSRQVAQAFAQNRPDVIAKSKSMQFVLSRAVEYGKALQPVLIMGETGAGKEIVAQTVHANSSRGNRDLVSLNCAAVPESLIERELFGHVRGAFTGADRDRDGIVDAAHKGTLFLDEIGELPLAMQAKLLRLLQNGAYRPVGATKEKHADIRIIAATHRNLFTMTRKGQFREDLYYRIAGLRISIPPLRERLEDTVALANLFMEEQSIEHGWHIWMDRDAWQLVRSFHWPGNVRQLQSVIRAACLIAGEKSVIKAEHLRELLAEEFDYFEAERARTSLNYHENIQATERRLIRAALEQSNYCRKTAAQLLGIGRNTIYEKIKKLGMEPELPEKSQEA